MTKPHAVLLDVAAGRTTGAVDDDIAALLRSADEHRMTGLLWSAVGAGAVEVPRETALVLAAADVTVRQHHAALERALGDAVGRLAERGIEAATFKGITAERRWYDRVGERPCVDVDLLLAPGAIDRGDDVVDALDPGYGGRRGLRERIAAGTQLAATLSFRGIAVDVHVEVPKLGPPSAGASLVWERTVPVPIADGSTVLALDAEAQLFAFLTHLLKDRMARLLGFVDVARVVEREELDWDVVDLLGRADGLDAVLPRVVDAVFDALDRPRPGVARRRARSFAPAWRVLYRPGVRLQGMPAGGRPRRLLVLPFVRRRHRVRVVRSLARRAADRLRRRGADAGPCSAP